MTMTTTTTATEFNRHPAKALQQAESGATVEITKEGRVTATLIPQPGVTPADALARSLREMEPQPEAAAEVARLIKGMDEAS